MADVIYGRPQISTLKLLFLNDRNAKQNPEKLHFKVGDPKSDNQGLYPGCSWLKFKKMDSKNEHPYKRYNLFTTSESRKIWIPIVQIFCYDFFLLDQK